MGQPIFGAANSPAAAAPYHDDGWEYEYDENDTEDLYFTLDLTTHVPDASAHKSVWLSNNGSETVRRTATPTQNDENGDTLNEEDSVPKDAARLQIIDLHTTNPLVKLDDEIFSCYWSTDLGTQVHIAEAGVIPTPRRAGTVLDVVGTSRSRLIGKPTILHPRAPADVAEAQSRRSSIVKTGAEVGSGQDSSEGSQRSSPVPEIQIVPGQALTIPRENCHTKASKEQASFLERLSQIKLKKGESDVVTAHGIRSYNPPANVEEIRQRDIAAEVGRERQAINDKLVAKGDRPRKRRRKLTYADKGFVQIQGSEKYGGRRGRTAVEASLGLQEAGPLDPAAATPSGSVQEAEESQDDDD